MNDISPYLAVQDQLGSCDLVEFRGNDELGKAIRLKTRYDTNHTAVVVLMECPYTGTRRRYMHEALNQGVIPTYLSDRLLKYDGQAFWYALREEFRLEIPQMVERIFQYTGVDYDFGELFKQLIGHTKIDLEAETHHIFCSMFAQVVHGAKNGDTAWWPGEIIEKMDRWYERVPLIKI